MIFSGRKRSATSRAKRRMTRSGTSAPRYQRPADATLDLEDFLAMRQFYVAIALVPTRRVGTAALPLCGDAGIVAQIVALTLAAHLRGRGRRH